MANSHTLGTCFSPRMWWADIEGAKHRRRYELLGGISLLSQSTFYPLSDGPSIQNHRITKTYFRTCSTCLSLQSSALCLYTLRPISDRSERTFVLLRYSLGETAPVKLPTIHCPRSDNGLELEPQITRVVFQGWLHANWRPRFKASHLSYKQDKVQCQAIVKVHGVFPSSRGYTASSQRFQFHWVSGGDSAAIVTPFVQVGTYPTRNFATLGPL